VIIIISAFKNLNFQKKHFPEIFNSYIQNKDNYLKKEDADSIKIESSNIVDIKDKIVIVNDNYIELLKFFNIPQHMMKEIEDSLYKYNEIIIVDSFLEDIIKDHKNKILTLNFSHGYAVHYYKISITNRFSYALLKDVAKVILMRNLNEFEKSILMKQDIDIEKINEQEDLKRFLFNIKCLYCEKNYIDQALNKKDNFDKNHLKLNPEVVKEHFDNLEFNYIQLDKIINDAQKKNNIKELLLDSAMIDFEGNSILMLKKILLEGEFAFNYFVVQIYIKNYEIFFNEISGIIKGENEIFEESLDKGINKIKAIVSKQLKDLREDIEKFFRV
jgi:hypothetical protein